MNSARKTNNPRPSTATGLSSATGLSPARRRMFVVVMLLTPVLFFLLLELLLRLLQYGPDLSLFLTREVKGRSYRVMNPEVKHRYFYRLDFHPSTSPDHFQIPKPPGSYRIFCLGASTTVGYPFWYNGSFSTFLRDRLRTLFPERDVEVINLGMTATNSYTVADIARELPSYEPDCLIVYDGHNEFYGALGVASHESLGRSRWINRLYLRLIHFRTFMLLRDIVSAASGLFAGDTPALPPATMMELVSRGQYIPYGSEEYRLGLAIFRENLHELRDICINTGIPLVVSTQVSNLRRQAPFISRGASEQSPASRVAFQSAINGAIADFLNADFPSALTKLQSVARTDTQHAELHFRIARCLDTLKRYPEASVQYSRARDLDELRFRASADFNEVIRSMEDGRKVFALDTEELFAASSPDSLIGSELITEHLHPNLRGHFIIAGALAAHMRLHGLVADTAEWRARDTIGDAWFWEERSTTTLDEMIGARKTAVLTSGWPFRDQPPMVAPIAATDTLGQLVERYVRSQITWERAHLEAAAHYEKIGRIQEAIREYRVLGAAETFDPSPLLRLGELLNRADQLPGARAAFRQSLEREETARGYAGLGAAALVEGAIAEAASNYRKALELSRTVDERAEHGYILALLSLRSGDRERAAQGLREVLREKPSHAQAREVLNRIGG